MKGDRVEIVVDAGDGVRTYEIAATRAGRRVEITTGRGVVEVTEVTRSGQPVRVGRFMAARVLALVEHPASDGAVDGEDGTPRAGRRTSTAPRPSPDPSSGDEAEAAVPGPPYEPEW